jgi:hypothetical protein
VRTRNGVFVCGTWLDLSGERKCPMSDVRSSMPGVSSTGYVLNSRVLVITIL